MVNTPRIFISPFAIHECVVRATAATARQATDHGTRQLLTGTLNEISHTGFSFPLFGVGPFYAHTIKGEFRPVEGGALIRTREPSEIIERFFVTIFCASVLVMIASPALVADSGAARTDGLLGRFAAEAALAAIGFALGFVIQSWGRRRLLRQHRTEFIMTRVFHAREITDSGMANAAWSASSALPPGEIPSSWPPHRWKRFVPSFSISAVLLAIALAILANDFTLRSDNTAGAVFLLLMAAMAASLGARDRLPEIDPRRQGWSKAVRAIVATTLLLWFATVLCIPLAQRTADPPAVAPISTVSTSQESS